MPTHTVLLLVYLSGFCSFYIGQQLFVWITVHRGYRTWDVVVYRQEFDEEYGYIGWYEKKRYRRRTLTCQWQRRVEELVVREPFLGLGKARLTKRYVWKDVSRRGTRDLERLFEHREMLRLL